MWVWVWVWVGVRVLALALCAPRRVLHNFSCTLFRAPCTVQVLLGAAGPQLPLKCAPARVAPGLRSCPGQKEALAPP